jgi:hypothetical protein
MHDYESIFSVQKIFKNLNDSIPQASGVYAFWWIGDRDVLLKSNRNIKFKGPGGAYLEVKYEDWWPDELRYPCLYIGKSTNIRKRFFQHIKQGCLHRLDEKPFQNQKVKPKTTSCQLRWGIEHIFPREERPLEIIMKSIGFSWRTDFPEYNSIAERFFEEDRLVGVWRPWFNIDSER